MVTAGTDIAVELGWRDAEIERLRKAVEDWHDAALRAERRLASLQDAIDGFCQYYENAHPAFVAHAPNAALFKLRTRGAAGERNDMAV